MEEEGVAVRVLAMVALIQRQWSYPHWIIQMSYVNRPHTNWTLTKYVVYVVRRGKKKYIRIQNFVSNLFFISIQKGTVFTQMTIVALPLPNASPVSNKGLNESFLLGCPYEADRTGKLCFEDGIKKSLTGRGKMRNEILFLRNLNLIQIVSSVITF